MPAAKSGPGARYGPSGANRHTAAVSSGSRAAVARAYGPPAEFPHTAARAMPRSARTARTSAAQSATTRPGMAPDLPRPGRS
jgi:hypothetical protein